MRLSSAVLSFFSLVDGNHRYHHKSVHHDSSLAHWANMAVESTSKPTFLPSFEIFQNAIVNANAKVGDPQPAPSKSVIQEAYDEISNVQKKQKFFSGLNEVAMFLANVLQETNMLVREQHCGKDRRKPSCNTGCGGCEGGKQYFGRGYLQLTHQNNYKFFFAYYNKIYGTKYSHLKQNDCNLVATKLAWSSAFYVWHRDAAGPDFYDKYHPVSGSFGYSINSINGCMECKKYCQLNDNCPDGCHGPDGAAQKRAKYFQALQRGFGLRVSSDREALKGCLY
ncbi:lysozyme-like domain-containing protein [Globomyces pollinis-pini]|nr:lysozyme-like domain-containing protein [Globomyces pollinis-pini]